MNHRKRNDVFLMQISALVLSFSNVFSKLAALEGSLTVRFFLFYALSLFIMMIYALLWQQILKRVSMTAAYSNRLVTIVWGVIWGCIFFHEKITVCNVIGTVIIFAGLFKLSGAEYEQR